MATASSGKQWPLSSMPDVFVDSLKWKRSPWNILSIGKPSMYNIATQFCDYVNRVGTY